MAVGLPVGVEGRVGVAEDRPLEDTEGERVPHQDEDTLTDAVEL